MTVWYSHSYRDDIEDGMLTSPCSFRRYNDKIFKVFLHLASGKRPVCVNLVGERFQMHEYKDANMESYIVFRTNNSLLFRNQSVYKLIIIKELHRREAEHKENLEHKRADLSKQDHNYSTWVIALIIHPHLFLAL